MTRKKPRPKLELVDKVPVPEEDPQIEQLLRMDAVHGRKRIHLDLDDALSQVTRFVYPRGTNAITVGDLLLKAVSFWHGDQAMPLIARMVETIEGLQKRVQALEQEVSDGNGSESGSTNANGGSSSVAED